MSSDDILIYKRRWLLLATTCLWSSIEIYLSECFGAANEIFALYFQTNLKQSDWMLLGLYAGTTLVTPIFAYLCHADLIGFRRMSIAAVVCLFIASCATIFVVQYPFLHTMLIPTNLLHGIAYSVSCCINTYFPVLWFPDHQVKIAVALLYASLTLGGLLSSVIPPGIIKPIPYDILHNSNKNNTNNLDDWKEATHNTLLWMFSALAISLCLILIYIAIYAADLPPKPPTYAMLKNRSVSTERPSAYESFKDFLKDTRLLFKNKMFLICIFVLGITRNMIMVEALHMTQLVGEISNYANEHGLSNSVLSGLVLVVFATSGIIFMLASAKILQWYKCYVIQTIFGTSLGLASGIAVYLSYHYGTLSGLFVSNIIFSLGNRFCVMPMLEIVTRITYPMNEAFVSAWVTGVNSLILVIMAEIARFTSDHLSSGSSLIVMCVVLFFAFILSLFFRPSDKRTAVDKMQADTNELSENLPLIGEN